ncbi:corepressor interacting with RBPJ 1 [Periplaneta americana]|uniref:corepressor interacting with RBPJ 1 n=1 Tax=Periplaneta americana TaxID=6978 RepID=UPI0037E7618C
MGKGFNNYMCKKFFHPASRDNLKRVWMAEQKAESYKKKQEELRVQYEKEQDLYTNKAILSKESKDKLSVNFMYEPPPGTKKEREREDDEPEYKFEWQRKFNAPREDYCKGDSEIRDQPFGIQVRNVRCIKCHKWGHINTDKECPMYNQASSSDQTGPSLDPLLLMQQMREDGLAMKRGLQQHVHFSGSRDLIPSDDEAERTRVSEMEFLKSLSVKQKRKLLRKLEKLEKKEKTNKINKKKTKKKKRSKQKVKVETSDSSSDTQRSEEHKKKKKPSRKEKERHSRTAKDASSPSSDSDRQSLEKALGRSIDFDGPKNVKKERVTNGQQAHSSGESTSERQAHHKRKEERHCSSGESSSERVSYRNVPHGESYADRPRKAVGRNHENRDRTHRKRASDGSDSAKKRQRQ